MFDTLGDEEVGHLRMSRLGQDGFSIIELSVALTIMGLLLSLGAPAFSGYLQNARLGTMAQGIYTGMQLARAEAVKRNQAVEFVLTSSSLETATADTAVPDAAGRNWVVRQRASASQPYALVEQKSTNTNDAGGVIVAATTSQIVFDSLGGSFAATVTLTNPALGLCLPAGPVRCWTVAVAAGGQVRLCNPDATLASSDTRACP
ncbi:MAG: GspH/FimT family pseudopilin [Ilumatobacteraceae bacterium]|nr:GspH/FimT family pseudopilin [Ilumatobacteraceae bacterium]